MKTSFPRQGYPAIRRTQGLGCALVRAYSQDTSFTYQGRLTEGRLTEGANEGANPVNGLYDLQFVV